MAKKSFSCITQAGARTTLLSQGEEVTAIFMFPSKCMDQSRHFNLFNNSPRIKTLPASHTPKLVMYFCLSLDKSF